MNIDALRCRPSRLLGREPVLVLGIVALAIGACMRELPALRHKVGVVEPLMVATEGRTATAEHLALTGRLETAAGAPPVSLPTGGQAVQVTRQPGGGLVIEREARPGRPPFRLSLNPALADDGIDAHVIWLCGQRRPPTGWTSPARPVVEGLTVAQLPAACRGNTG